MKVLFINFNLGSTPGLNNGIAILSAVLKRHTHQTRLLFLNEQMEYPFDLARIERDICSYRPDLIAISLMEPQRKYMTRFARDLRRYFAGFVICGGPFPSMDPEAILQEPEIDAVCVGEGEAALTELANALEQGTEYRSIQNLWFRNSDGSIQRNSLRPFQPLDDLPADDKELFDIERLLTLKNYQLETMLGRGCAYRCAYCINHAYVARYQALASAPSGYREYIRIKKADTLIQELKETLQRHPGVREIAFIDDNFLMYRDFVRDFCVRYAQEIHLPFVCNANPLSFGKERAQILRNAGCRTVRFGIESGSERVKREILNRPISNASTRAAFETAREFGLGTSSYNMMGMPTETCDEILATLRLNSDLRPDYVKLMTFYPFKNTPIHDYCSRLNILDEEKKDALDNYDSFSCLKLGSRMDLFLRKTQFAFDWYLNAFLENESSETYRRLLAEIESMSDSQWAAYDFDSVDREVSEKFQLQGVPHYRKLFNRSLAALWPGKTPAVGDESAEINRT
jgi:anaerobic magnesium-protoporphyrin IX monomethyl ester cyclase